SPHTRPARRPDRSTHMPVGIVHRDAATAVFFDGTARGDLLIGRCGRCGGFSAPQERTCAHCGSPGPSLTPAAGTGTVISWSVVHGRSRDGEPGPRTVVAIVELDEGPWLQAQVTGMEPEDVSAGSRVRAAFERPEDGEAVPVFVPL
ncbi:OB-fold domain-containing protein, partial [Sphaerisporangium sp. NPDC088356]|uniref:Zn-ribbon domain-containing OB-fold protein n=1 Tax=Sphaerisporangium sp. NPDC088356 TaxID=3154871 RepID=UPI003437FD5C